MYAWLNRDFRAAFRRIVFCGGNARERGAGAALRGRARENGGTPGGLKDEVEEEFREIVGP